MNQSDKAIFATIFFAIFSAVMGVGIVVPLLPVYAESLGASGFYIGLIFSSFSLSRTFLLPLFGRLSDRTGRKPYITLGLLGYAVVSVAFIFAETVPGLIWVRFVQGMASAMIMPVAQAYIGDITSVNREGVTMGMFNMSMFAGLSIGPLVGGVINDTLGLEAAFIGMGVLSMVGFLLAFVFLPPVSAERKVSQSEDMATWATLLTDKTIVGLFLLRFVYVFCIGTIWCFLPVLADGMGLSSSKIGVLVMLGVFVSGALQLPMGVLADRAKIGRAHV
jgi:MFS transporter, DHA1 family, multidrug resistance protein